MRGGEQKRVDIRGPCWIPEVNTGRWTAGNLIGEFGRDYEQLCSRYPRNYGTAVIMATHDYIVVKISLQEPLQNGNGAKCLTMPLFQCKMLSVLYPLSNYDVRSLFNELPSTTGRGYWFEILFARDASYQSASQIPTGNRSLEKVIFEILPANSGPHAIRIPNWLKKLLIPICCRPTAIPLYRRSVYLPITCCSVNTGKVVIGGRSSASNHRQDKEPCSHWRYEKKENSNQVCKNMDPVQPI